ncbi:hypothetical protein LINPERHAP1_LOCUS37941 [Linum perenne]
MTVLHVGRSCAFSHFHSSFSCQIIGSHMKTVTQLRIAPRGESRQ